jgi:hypothetical protein
MVENGPNRNRWFTWFTVLKNGWIFHGYVSHNQMVNHGKSMGNHSIFGNPHGLVELLLPTD